MMGGGGMGVKEEEASAIDFYYRGGGRGERTAVPCVNDTPAANRSDEDAMKQSPASVGSSRCVVCLNQPGPQFNWARPNPLLKSFSIYSN
jgi:hypothetical protein